MMLAEIASTWEGLGQFRAGFSNRLSVSRFCYSYEIGATMEGRLWSTLQIKGESILEICR
jgi:hypothetical protein